MAERYGARPGPLFTDLLLADEINRASAKTQAALLEAMQERAATVDGTRHPLGPHFAVFATQNPVEQEGTYPLPEAELDRFLFKIVIEYPSEEEEAAILALHHAGDRPPSAAGGARPTAPLPPARAGGRGGRRADGRGGVRRGAGGPGGAAGAGTAAAMAVVVWPALWPALAGGLALLGALAAWDLTLLRRRPPLGLARRLPGRAFVGHAAEIALTLENPAREPVSVEVMDEVPADLAAEEPRFTGVLVPPAASVTLRYPIRPSVRGDRRLGPSIALERSPLGWLRRRTVAGADAVLAVYPDATRYLRPEALAPKRVLAAMGVRPSPRRGGGRAFQSVRDYA